MSWLNLPEALKQYPQWVGAREDKIPVDPKTGKTASVTDPNTWGTFEQATACGLPHIGFVFTRDDPFVFIDLDTGKHPDCVNLHNEIIGHANSYTELSKSGQGYHIVVNGELPHGLRDDIRGIELYPFERYMLATGWAGATPRPVQDCQDLLDYLSNQIQQSRFQVKDLDTDEMVESDEDLYTKIAQADNGDKFVALFTGYWQGYDEYHNDHSRADLALLTFLDFYTKNVDQVLRLFKYSKLYRPSKGRRGGDGTDYILRTLKQARARNEADQPPMVDATVLMERVANAISKPAVAQESQAPSYEVTFPPGLIGEIANYIYTSATRPVPEVALMGALALFSGITGRQYNIEGSGLNLYLILLAATGTGKEGARSGINSLLSKVRETIPSINEYVGPAEFSSGPALIKALGRQPCMFSILGEFGLRLQQMADTKSSSAEKTLQRALLDLYQLSGWHQVIQPTVYSEQEKNTEIIQAPALTIIGESTPETFFKNLSEQQVLSGLLPRFTFLEYKGARPPRNTVSAFCEPDPGLVSRVADLASCVIQMQANNANCPIAIDLKAKELLDQFDKYCDNRINKGEEVYKQLWNRAHMKANRLAGLLAVSTNYLAPVVTQELAEWAIQFTSQDVLTIENRFSTNEIGEGDHRLENYIRNLVDEYLRMPPEKRLASKAWNTPKAIANHPIIPFDYLRKRLKSLSAFKQDRRGSAKAITETLKDLVQAGVLDEVPILKRKEYGTRAAIYMIGENW